MRHILIGIYDEDAVYGKRLMEYINRQKEYPLTAAAFTSAEALNEFVKTQDVKGLILEEGVCIHEDIPVFYMKKDQTSSACRYGNAKEIVKEAYDTFKPGSQMSVGLTGIYSPSENRKRTEFALQLARQNHAFYFEMESYGQVRDEKGMEDLLLAVKMRRDKIMELVNESAVSIEGVKGICSARCFLDYREISVDDYQWFFQQMTAEGIPAVLDIGTACIYDFKLFTICDHLYLPIWEEDMEDPRLLGFKELSEHHPILSELNWKEVFLSENQSLLQNVESLMKKY